MLVAEVEGFFNALNITEHGYYVDRRSRPSPNFGTGVRV